VYPQKAPLSKQRVGSEPIIQQKSPSRNGHLEDSRIGQVANTFIGQLTNRVLWGRGSGGLPLPLPTRSVTLNSLYSKKPPDASVIWRIFALDRCPIFLLDSCPIFLLVRWPSRSGFQISRLNSSFRSGWVPRAWYHSTVSQSCASDFFFPECLALRCRSLSWFYNRSKQGRGC
jgi:hypothetical protein